MKTCSRCKKEKPFAEFNRHYDGFQSLCRRCQVITRREWMERTGKTYKNYGHENRIARQRQRRKKHPERHRANLKVQAALKSGRLTRPAACQSCGEDPGLARNGRTKIFAHHPDYAKPLEVEWLCSRCHGRLHFLSVLTEAA